MRKEFKKIVAVYVFCLFSSVFAAGYLKDGVYSFDYERVLVSLDVAEMYKAYGINARQDVSKIATGAAVLVEDSTFVDPESGLIVKVEAGGKITSPDNESIQGEYKRNGNICFFGTYFENNQTIQIVLQGTLRASKNTERAGDIFNGEYHATDPGTGKNQTIWIENGLYMWKYDDAGDDDFSGWPMIVGPDGNFNYVSEYTTRAVMYGLSETYITTKTHTTGKFEPDGSLQLKILTVNSGTGQQENEIPLVYSAVKATEIVKTGNAPVYRAMSSQGNKNRRAKNAVVQGVYPEEGIIPVWFTEKIVKEGDYIIACGKKQSYEPETAGKLAEAVAVNQVIAFLGTEIKTSTEANSIQSDYEKQTYFYRTLENLTLKNISYEVINSFSDSASNYSYVQIKVNN